MQIGELKKTQNGFTGSIRTLNLEVRNFSVERVEKRSENSPDYRVRAKNGAELGAGWIKESRDGNKYVSLKLDDISFPRPISAAIVMNQENEKGPHRVVWNRPARQQEKARDVFGGPDRQGNER